MTDNITLPREVVQFMLQHLEWWSDDEPQEKEAIEALRKALAAEPTKQEPVAWIDRFGSVVLGKGPYETFTTPLYTFPPALAAEQPKPEPVAWLSRDEARLALWKAINSREFGNPTDDKLILDHLRQQGLWIGKVTSPAPPEDEALRRDAERLKDAMRKAMAMLDKHEPEPAGAFAVLLLALNPELQSAKNAALRREE